MSSNYLIIGATGAIGYAFVNAMQNSGVQATLLVRDRAKAMKLFDHTDGLRIVQGDVHNAALLKQIAEGTQYIFHGANTSYKNWAKEMPAITRNVIETAEHAQATVIFPGNNYNFGQIGQPISEFTPFNPAAPLGKVRIDLERMLQRATDQGRIRTLVARMAEIWGPNVTNKQFAPVFENALRAKPMPWPISTEPAQQLLFAPDAGRALVALTQTQNSKAYDVVNIGGTLVPSIQSWLAQIADVAGVPAQTRVTPKFVISLLGLVRPVMRHVASLSYKYETSVILNDAKFYAAHPEFEQTPISDAIATTLEWFKTDGPNA